MRKLLLFTVPFACSTLLYQYLLPTDFRVNVAVALAALGALGVLLAKKHRKMAAIMAVGLLAGAIWFTFYAAHFLRPCEALAGTEAEVTFTVEDYGSETSYGIRWPVRIEGVPGGIYYYGSADLSDLEPGDRVTAHVKFYSAVTLSGGESPTFISQGIFLRMYGKGEPLVIQRGERPLRYLPQRLGRWMRETVRETYEQPVHGFLTALLTGDRTELDAQSRSDLEEAGLMHITAVSGLHCGFLISFLGILVFRRRRLTALIGYPVLLLYMAMAGSTPSVVRACIMLGLFLLAPLLGREGDSPTSLSAALLILLLANPFSIASLSLQLSFGAVTGLSTAGVWLEKTMGDCWQPEQDSKAQPLQALQSLWKFLTSSVAASLSVMLFTAPLSAIYFGSLSLCAPLANLLVLWAAPALFALTLVLTPLCAAVPTLAFLSVLPAGVARYVMWIAGRIAEIPGGTLYFTRKPAVLWMILVYAMLAICLLSKARGRTYLVAAAAALVCLSVVRAASARLLQDAALVTVAVDVGQGAATLFHAGDTTALVDCGSLSHTAPGGDVAAVMDTYGWNVLDCVALTHYHSDHAGGLGELFAKVEVHELLLPQLATSEQAELQAEVLTLAERYNVPVRYVQGPVKKSLGNAVLFLYPPLSAGEANEEGLTVLCTDGDFDVLITGDMSATTERLLVKTYALPDIEVLMVGHHGSKYATSEELLAAVTPEIGVISVGTNTFGHPTAEAMGRCAAVGMTLYRTDLQGDVVIISDETNGEP